MNTHETIAVALGIATFVVAGGILTMYAVWAHEVGPYNELAGMSEMAVKSSDHNAEQRDILHRAGFDADTTAGSGRCSQ